jgi:hypothetical protein
MLTCMNGLVRVDHCAWLRTTVSQDCTAGSARLTKEVKQVEVVTHIRVLQLPVGQYILDLGPILQFLSILQDGSVIDQKTNGNSGKELGIRSDRKERLRFINTFLVRTNVNTDSHRHQRLDRVYPYSLDHGFHSSILHQYAQAKQ